MLLVVFNSPVNTQRHFDVDKALYRPQPRCYNVKTTPSV